MYYDITGYILYFLVNRSLKKKTFDNAPSLPSSITTLSVFVSDMIGTGMNSTNQSAIKIGVLSILAIHHYVKHLTLIMCQIYCLFLTYLGSVQS